MGVHDRVDPWHYTRVNVRGQFYGVSSLLLPSCEVQRLNSGPLFLSWSTQASAWYKMDIEIYLLNEWLRASMSIHAIHEMFSSVMRAFC